MNRTALAIKMLALLQVSGKIKKKEIADKLEVKERYVVDLKNELITAGYNIVTESGIDGGYWLDDSMLIHLPKLTSNEESSLLALYSDISSSTKPIGTIDAIAAFEKICSELQPDKGSPTLLNYALSQREETKEDERRYFTELIYAKKNGLKIHAKYDSFSGNSDRDRTIHPYTVTRINDYYYLIGYEEGTEIYKLYKLIRFVSLEIADDKYKKDMSYDAKVYVDNLGGKAIGEEVRLKLRITGPYMKTLEETPYGKDVVITRHDDHSIYETTLRGDFIINEFILKMGGYCKVVEPKILRQKIKENYELWSKDY